MPELQKLNEQLAAAEPREILDWAIRSFPYQTAMTSSFQASGIVLIHMLRTMSFDFPIFFIDTGYHFPETIEYKNRLVREWKLNVHTIVPVMSKTEQNRVHGPRLFEHNPDLCCRLNKVEPLDALQRELELKGWISALRRDQAETRKGLKPVMKDSHGVLRIHPLINWDRRNIWAYIDAHGLPTNPLYDQGYASIGCFPPCCTSKSEPGSDERSGRWAGKGKVECGLHSHLKNEN
ncbi:MAG: phosphoadenylyl-sulfate reductase [Candidatus Aminicenantes bacterium]|nr:phosphoadenylyl-sulfate reductase [Candidatus Aminicenantes bacterium]